MMPPLFAPQIDAVIDNLKSDPDLMNQKIYQCLREIQVSLGCIKPFGDDDIRQIWVEVERGPVEVFGDYEECKESGEVNNLDEFVELWQDYYPQKTKWYKFQTVKFRNDLFFYFGDKLIFNINNQEQPATEGKSGWNLEFLENFVHWLAEKIVEVTSRFTSGILQLVSKWRHVWRTSMGNLQGRKLYPYLAVRFRK